MFILIVSYICRTGETTEMYIMAAERERETPMECLFKKEAHHTEEDLKGVAGVCLRERCSPTAPWGI